MNLPKNYKQQIFGELVLLISLFVLGMVFAYIGGSLLVNVAVTFEAILVDIFFVLFGILICLLALYSGVQMLQSYVFYGWLDAAGYPYLTPKSYGYGTIHYPHDAWASLTDEQIEKFIAMCPSHLPYGLYATSELNARKKS